MWLLRRSASSVNALEYGTVSVAYGIVMATEDLVKRSAGATDEMPEAGRAGSIEARLSTAELKCNNR